MDPQKLLSFLSLLLILLIVGKHDMVEAATGLHRHHRHRKTSEGIRKLFHSSTPKTLFVFGNSYVDTGNSRKSLENSWKYPYGITFPGKPVGRSSSGRVLTDFIAKYLGLKSPIPYKYRKLVNSTRLQYGMNFAYGGTGVFDTSAQYPNMTSQIDLLQNLLNDSVYSITDSSVALVSVSGNDYTNFLSVNPKASLKEFQSFISKVVAQVGVNLNRINELGVKNIMVTGLEPSGCVPYSTISTSYQKCNETLNYLVQYHNILLQQVVAKINDQTNNSTFILDLYISFFSVIESKKFEDPLRPCCVGISSEYSCSNVDEEGEKKYTVCEDPESSFFWDALHPTQAGWSAVSSTLLSTF